MEGKRGDLVAQLAQLEERKANIPNEIFLLRKKFNNELTYGEPQKAEQCRTTIQGLELERRQLLSKIREVELDLEKLEIKTSEVNRDRRK